MIENVLGTQQIAVYKNVIAAIEMREIRHSPPLNHCYLPREVIDIVAFHNLNVLHENKLGLDIIVQ